VATEELALAILPGREARNSCKSGRTTGRTPCAAELGGEQSSFEALMAAHERMVIGTAYRLLGRIEDAQDAAQEVFLRLLKNLNRIQGDPKPWLYRVTVNICNDRYRRRVMTTEPDESAADPAPDAEHVLDMHGRKRLLMEGLETLSKRERAAVVLAGHRGTFDARGRRDSGNRRGDCAQPDFSGSGEAGPICQE
jgi:RNA polymerase sigma factor (sigma-70 family)